MNPSDNFCNQGFDRRRFIKAGLGFALGMPFMKASAITPRSGQYRNAMFPIMGANGGLGRAQQVYDAGGDFLLERVAAFLKPAESEAAFEDQLRRLDKSPLPILSCNSFLRGPALRSVGPDAKTDNVMRFAETAFRRAKRAGVKNIVFGSSGSRKKPDGWTKAQVDEEFIALLKRMGPIAGEYGIIVAVENLQARECNYLTRLHEVGEIIEAVDHPHVRMLADLYHASCMQDPAEDLLKYGHLVEVVEIAEKDGRTVPGVKGQDFRPYFHALAQVSFKGPIEIEGRWKETDVLASAFKTIHKQSS